MINNQQLNVELDSGESIIIPKNYHNIDYGYALTVHKSQGMTVKHTKVLIDSKYWDRHLSFVAMTRHTQSLKIYADSNNHPDLTSLNSTLSRSVTKDNVIDWPLNYAIRKGFNPDQLMGKVLNHVVGIGHKIKHGFNFVANLQVNKDLMVEYTELVKKSSRLSGYYREKMEQKIQVLAQSILGKSDERHKIMEHAKNSTSKCIDI